MKRIPEVPTVTNLLPTHTFISSFPPPFIGRGEEERQASEKRRREITPTRLWLLSEVLIRGSTSSAELSELVTRAHSLDGCELRRHVLRTCESCHTPGRSSDTLPSVCIHQGRARKKRGRKRKKNKKTTKTKQKTKTRDTRKTILVTRGTRPCKNEGIKVGER